MAAFEGGLDDYGPQVSDVGTEWLEMMLGAAFKGGLDDYGPEVSDVGTEWLGDDAGGGCVSVGLG